MYGLVLYIRVCRKFPQYSPVFFFCLMSIINKDREYILKKSHVKLSISLRPPLFQVVLTPYKD